MKHVWILIVLSLFVFSACASRSDQIEQGAVKKETDGRHEVKEIDDHNQREKCQNELANKTLAETVAVDESGKKVVTNPDDFLVVVNKERNLAETYEPGDLVVPNVPFPFEEDSPKKKMRKTAAEALERMFQAAEAENIRLFAQSGYRSYDRQKAIFAYNASQRGEEQANQVSAHAGQSEHQTGLAMDVTNEAVGYQLVTSFAETKEGKWLAEHAHEFGFIIRYPKGKENITGYQFEPWHIRYVGEKHAKAIKEKKITLEEYLTPTKDRSDFENCSQS